MDVKKIKIHQGHDVLLIEINKDYVRFLNSWGSNWGDRGTFKVKHSNILKPFNSNDNPSFYDIVFYEKDLNLEEKSYYSNNIEYIRNLISQYGEMNIEAIRNHINHLYHYTFTCEQCNERMIFDKLEKYIKNGLHHIKCPLCNNSNIAKNKLRELLIFENLMHDGNEDFDINFKEPYYIEIQRVELHQSFENNITNKSDRCTIGSENPLEKAIDSIFIKEVSCIISLENGNFVACSPNMIIIFELKDKKINYLIMRNILNDSLLTLCDLKISNLIAVGGEDLKIFKINLEKKELNLQLRYFDNKKKIK